MTPELISAIQTFTLNSRKLLERETEEQLQGLYGWLPDGSFGSGTALSMSEAAETKARLKQYVAEETDAGVGPAESRAKLKRETAFTWLNRAVAFRLMEERGIIKSTFGKLHKSNAFIYWITDVLGEGSLPASMPINSMGEGPVDAAYRRFLLWQCDQLAKEVSVLFDAVTLASRFCPRPAVLKDLADKMNSAELADAWKTGNEESLGWIYEGFIEDDNTEVFEKFNKGKKVLPEEIGAATQRFTPRWIVQFLIHNSLGRVWLEMHPDSLVARSLEYLLPLKAQTTRAPKAVSDITFLDPCCGSMHFGLLAFDLFVEMYREERNNTGMPGWPEKASAESEEQIPELILSRNLHGIDIDLRAVQVSGLALLLRARTVNPKAKATDSNLACANIEAFTGGRMDELIKAAKFSNRSEERVLRALSIRVKESPHLGSLLRLECDLKSLVEAERKKLIASSQPELLLAGLTDDLFKSTRDLSLFFDQLASSIASILDTFARDAGSQSQHTATEAAKGLRFLRLVEQRYDVVATNPPYMSRRNMSDIMTKYLDNDFKSSKGDLYAAFIVRCTELANPLGLVAMVTQQSFMFISSYENMRADLRQTIAVESMVHLGPRAFPNITGEKVNTTAFVMRRETDESQREKQVGTYFRLVRERDADGKRLAFEASLAALRQGEEYPQLFHYQQAQFDRITRKPWTYWTSMKEWEVFRRTSTLGSSFEIDMGLKTSGNVRFVRFWWEIGSQGIELSETPNLCRISPKKWFRYGKGGRGLADKDAIHIVNWEFAGAEIKSYLLKRYPYLNGNVAWCTHNEALYFEPAITWTSVSTKGLQVKMIEPGVICSNANYAIFSKSDTAHALFAYLSSEPARYFARLLCPTINHNKGDIALIPIPDLLDSNVMREGGRRLFELSRKNDQFSEDTLVFRSPRSANETESGPDLYSVQEFENVETFVYEKCGLEEHRNFIQNEILSVSLEDADGGSDEDMEGEVECGERENSEVAVEVGSPTAWARCWISYAFGTVLGRFEVGTLNGFGCGNFSTDIANHINRLIDKDGIMPCELGHPQDIASRTYDCLQLMLGAVSANDAIRTATEIEGDPLGTLRGWLDRITGTPDRSFWKYHYQLYRKRPVYWPFQSPQKTFTVWVFHEKLGPNTLHTIKELVDVRLNLLERSEMPPLRLAAATNRTKEKELGRLLEKSDDLREFSNRLKQHVETGYQTCPNDGILLNAAPLHDLFPNWTDTKKAWEELMAAKHDWAHQAMRYWPTRVTDACRTDRSFAIAHGLEHLCPSEAPKTAKKRSREKISIDDNLL